MQLGLTIPLQRFLKIKRLAYGPPANLHFCWDLHCITLQGQHSLLAVHCTSRYTFTLFGLSFAEWASLPEVFTQGLAASLTAAGFSEKDVQRYSDAAESPTFTKTHGRRPVAHLNRAWLDVLAADLALSPATISQPVLDAL